MVAFFDTPCIYESKWHWEIAVKCFSYLHFIRSQYIRQASYWWFLDVQPSKIDILCHTKIRYLCNFILVQQYISGCQITMDYLKYSDFMKLVHINRREIHCILSSKRRPKAFWIITIKSDKYCLYSWRPDLFRISNGRQSWIARPCTVLLHPGSSLPVPATSFKLNSSNLGSATSQCCRCRYILLVQYLWFRKI